MNEIRYCLPSSEGDAETRVALWGRGGEGGGGDWRAEKNYNVDYQNLNWILETRDFIEKGEGKEAAHQFFMQNYHSLIVRSAPSSLGEPLNVQQRLENKKRQRRQNGKTVEKAEDSPSMGFGFRSSLSLPPLTLPPNLGGEVASLVTDRSVGHVTNVSRFPPILPPSKEDNMSHDIRDWLPLLHNSKKHINPVRLREQKLKQIRKLLHKMPFERTGADIEEILDGLKLFPILTKQVTPAVLKELCAVAQIDEWQEPDVTIFGTTGFHIILRGSVIPYAIPFVRTNSNAHEFEQKTPEPSEILGKLRGELKVGDCFGTLKKLEGRQANSRILSVSTKEPNCEFIKISTSDFTSVQEQITQRETTAKINLVQGSESYQSWPKQPVTKLASLLEWLTFPANSVIVKEGRRSPFLAFIRSGDCHILKRLAIQQKGKENKQVVIGKLTKGQSFGEISVMKKLPATCSVVSSSPIELGIIKPEKLYVLDDITKHLLTQTSSAILKDMSKDKIHEEFIQQELNREWIEYKMKLVEQVVKSTGKIARR